MNEERKGIKILVGLLTTFFLIILILPSSQGDFTLPPQGGGMVHQDLEMSENIRLLCPTINVGELWYRDDLRNLGKLKGTMGNSIAGNGNITACSFGPFNVMGGPLKPNDKLIIFDYFGNQIWSSGWNNFLLNISEHTWSLNSFACSSTPLVDRNGWVIACDNKKIILINATNQNNVSVKWITNLSGGIPFSPSLVENESIILPTAGGPVYLFDVDTGELLANITLGKNTTLDTYWGIPEMSVIDYFKIYKDYALGSLPYWYNETSGLVEWNSSITYGIMPLDRNIFIDINKGEIFFSWKNIVTYYKKQGLLNWEKIVSNEIESPGICTGDGFFSTINSATVDGNRVYLATEYVKPGIWPFNISLFNNTVGKLYALEVKPDEENESDRLEEIWNYTYFGRSQATPTLINDTLYFDGYNNTLDTEKQDPHIYAIYTNNGTEKWKEEADGITLFTMSTDPRGGIWYEDADQLPWRPFDGNNKLFRYNLENGSSIGDPLDMKLLLDDDKFPNKPVVPCSTMTICGNENYPIMLISANHKRFQEGKWVLAVNLTTNSTIWKVPVESPTNFNLAGGSYTILRKYNQSRVIFPTFTGGVMCVGQYPNASFDDIEFQFSDSPIDNNSYYDSVQINYSVKTVIPDRVLVKAMLVSEDHPILCKYTSTANHEVTSEYVNGSLNVTLTPYAPEGEYKLYVFLYNSSGEINDIVHNTFNRVNLNKKYANITYNPDETFYMHPLNDPPAKPLQPWIIDIENNLTKTFATNTTDPNENNIWYQWRYDTGLGLKYYTRWVMGGPYESGENCTRTIGWLFPGTYDVQVRAKDNILQPNVFSNWSDPLEVTVTKHNGAAVPWNNELLGQFTQTLVTPTQQTYCNGFAQSVFTNSQTRSSLSWNWSFGDGTYSEEQNVVHNYSQTGTYIVNLTLYNGDGDYFNCTVDVSAIILKSDFIYTGGQPDKNVSFFNCSSGVYSIVNWTWDFGDGNNSYEENPKHIYTTPGIYNVSLTVKDEQNNFHNSTQTIYIETINPQYVSVVTTPDIIGLDQDVTICVDLLDNKSGINSIFVNITSPDNEIIGNYSMEANVSYPYDYVYIFNETNQCGFYNYSIWVVDKANNTNYTTGHFFNISQIFGCTTSGNNSKDISNNISGSFFTMMVNGTADSISAYIQTDGNPAPKTRCMIYRVNDSVCIGSSDNKSVNTGGNPSWILYNFSKTSPPTLIRDTEYVLSIWSNSTAYIYYVNSTSFIGRYSDEYDFGSSPDPISWTENEKRIYSLFCRYSNLPEVSNVTASPSTVGFGYNVTISCDIEDNAITMDDVKVNISYPNNTTCNYTMNNTFGGFYQYTFSDTWIVGQYNYSIWAKDKLGGYCISSEYCFNVSSQATISVCTVKDEYGDNEIINLTDPPGEPPLVGYELLDNADVLHIWNKHDNYYFDTDSGIQLTNHYGKYWSHNVLMLGYYNNDQWNLIYRTDELSGFNKGIDTDNETYINVTIWKNLEYQGYDFRLAIRYNLGIDDNKLTVIPYIKNLDQNDIPYTLGFGWEMNDIQIDMTETGDYINVNQTMYYLNQTLDKSYTNLPESEFYLIENKTDNSTKSLYLKWNNSLTYKLQVKSRDGQYNAPVTLFVKIGTLNSGQEKYTEMYWYDADQKTFYFDNFDGGETWTTNPSYMTDGSISNYASTTIDGDIELCDGNTCPGDEIGDISAVEIRVCAYYSGGQRNILLRPVFGGTTDGHNIRYTPTLYANVWSPWFDITGDPYGPATWSWSDVDSLDCDVEVETSMGLPFAMYCSKVEIRVTFDQYDPPGISNPVPSDGSEYVSLTPTLNITVSDEDSDAMTITWLSNSSGSWQTFGVNSSVYDGTYHQVFSNATENGKWWYWKVNVSDENNYTESDVFKFYTGCQSKVNNTGSYNFKGYLLMEVQFYNETSEVWEVADDAVNETTPRTMLWADPSGGENQHIFALDSIFNGLVNTSNLSTFGNGTYRVYAAFTDPYGNVLVCDDETELEATYEFSITF